MKKLFTLLFFLFLFLAGIAQNNTEAVQLLFGNTKTRLTTIEKNQVYQQSGLYLSKDKKQFVLGDDPSSVDHPFTVQVWPVDLNKDGKEEIFLIFGNRYTSGETGTNVLLFIKNKTGMYQPNFGFSGASPAILPVKNLAYPDLLIGGPGIDFPVWRWNGKEYIFSRKITGKNLAKIKTVEVEVISKTYMDAIK